MTDKKNTFYFLDTDVFKRNKKDKELKLSSTGKKYKVPHVESLSAETFSIIAGLQKDKDDAAASDDLQKMVKTTIDIVYFALSQKNKVGREEIEKIPFDELSGIMGWILKPSEDNEPFLEEGHGATTEEQESK